jgi:hypothetical protein
LRLRGAAFGFAAFLGVVAFTFAIWLSGAA